MPQNPDAFLPGTVTPAGKARREIVPRDYAARWNDLLDLVDGGASMEEAFAKTYPEISPKGRGPRIHALRFQNQHFAALVEARKRAAQLDKAKFSKSQFLERLLNVATFNVANLYEQVGSGGEVRLRDDWLAIAKRMNVIKLIKVKRHEDGTQEINIVPYDAMAAVHRLGQAFAYIVDTVPGPVQNIAQMNVQIVAQIEKIRELAASGTGGEKEVTGELVEELLEAEIVEPEQNGELK